MKNDKKKDDIIQSLEQRIKIWNRNYFKGKQKWKINLRMISRRALFLRIMKLILFLEEFRNNSSYKNKNFFLNYFISPRDMVIY